jgi:hypothetical protein
MAAIHGKTLRKDDELITWLRTPDWLAYPIMFIRQVTPKYPTDADLKTHHTQELAGLVTGFAHWRELKPETLLLPPSVFALPEDSLTSLS